MNKIKLFYISNVMLVANGLANFIGAVLVNALLSNVERHMLPMSIASAIHTFHIIFTSTAFSFAIIFTLLYERPIRQYLNALPKNTAMPRQFISKARRRLLNEPFVLLALDLGIWLTAAIVYSAFHWILGGGTLEIQSTISDALANGLVTATLAFFLLEHVLQKILAPYVFPEGGLYKIPKTMRIRIRIRLAALMVACSLIPLLSILHIMHRIPLIQPDATAALEQLRLSISVYVFVFLSLSFILTVLVSRNLTSPFKKIIQTLKGVRNGRFDKKIRVTSNDEIGYTGDVINEMIVGLKEREIIKDIFGKYVAKEVRDEVLSGKVPLDGEKKIVTVLFSDLRDFTSITESNDPKLVIKIMNSYFKEMDEAIRAQNGLVLQFIGDGIYAVFGAPVFLPDHSSKAFRAGIEMNRRLTELNLSFKKNGWPILRHGIGIHTGEALAANIGSPERLSYTLMGDNINIASRLQTLTKEMDSNMIISAVTYDGLTKTEQTTAGLTHLPPTMVKGKKQLVEIIAVT